MGHTAITQRVDSAAPVAGPVGGALRVAARAFVFLLIGSVSLIGIESLERANRIGQLEGALGQLAIWLGMSIAAVLAAVRWKLSTRPMTGLLVFVVCTTLAWSLGVANAVRSADATPLLGNGGMLFDLLPVFLVAGGALALGDLGRSLMRTVQQQREEQATTISRLDEESRSHRAAARNLNESKSLYSSLVDSLDQCIFRKDATGRFTFGNRKCCATMGLQLDDLLGKTDDQLFPPELASKYRNDDLKVMESASPIRDVEKYVRPDGEVIDIEIVKTPVFDAAGQVCGVQGAFWDVTEQKRSHELVRQNERRLKIALDATGTSCWEWNLDTGEYGCTRPSVEWLGYATDSVPSSKEWWDSLVHPDERPSYEQALSDHINGRTDHYECQYRVRDESGNWRWIYDRGKIIATAAENEPRLFVGTATDITEFKQSEQALAESEEKFRNLFDAARDAILIVDAETGYVLDANPAAGRLMGVDSERLVGTHQAAMHPPAETSRYRRMFNEHVRSGRGVSVDLCIQRLDDELVPVDVTGAVFTAGGRKLIQSTFRDVTERKKAEQAVRESERRYRSVFELAGLAVCVVDAESDQLIEVNKKYAKLLGYTVEELAGKTWSELTHPEDLPKGRENTHQLIAGNVDEYTTEKRQIHKNGELVWMKLTVTANPDFAASPRHRIVIGDDITDRKRADREIQIRAAQQAAVAEFGQLAISGVGLTELIDESVQRLSRLLQCEYAKVMEVLADGRSIVFRSSVGWSSEVADNRVISVDSDSQAGTTLRSREPVIVENLPEDDRFEFTPQLRAHGVMSGMTVVIDGPDRPFGLLGVHTRQRRAFSANDINFLQAIANILAEAIARKKAEDSLRDSEEQYRVLLDNHVDGVVVTYENRIRYVNDRMTDLFGYSRAELLQQSLFDFLEPEDRDAAERQSLALLRYGEESAAEYRMRHQAGQLLIVEISTRLVRHRSRPAVLSVVRDVTLSKELQEESRRHHDEMAHFNRISTMGELATGMAHELNQPLTSIATYASIGAIKLREKADGTEMADVVAVMDRIQEQSLRAGEIIHRLRAFVKKDPPEPTEFNMNEAVRSVASLLESEFKRCGIVCRFDLSDELPLSVGSTVQIEQIILNLMRNATEAMRDGDPDRRELKVTTKRNEAGATVVEVSDMGPGVETEQLEAMFDAFVTTKADGMGLGLAISRSIAEAHQGSLTATHNETSGLTFRLTLPSAPND